MRITKRSLQLRQKSDGIDTDCGISIVEIVVSVLLLGLLAIAFLPFLLTSLRVSIENVATVTATEAIGQQVDILRNNAQDCATLASNAASLDEIVYTNQGHEIAVINTITHCDDDANTATVSFEAYENGSEILRLSSQILVGVGS